MRIDEELNKLLSHVTIASGGVVPNFHIVLTSKKKAGNVDPLRKVLLLLQAAGSEFKQAACLLAF